MRRAIEISSRALYEPDTEPFGAVVVREGQIVGQGVNQSALKHDPTSHGETEAIRDACRNLKTVDLRGCELYTSCEPCTLCVAAMGIAGISRLYYAAGLEQSGAILDGLPETSRFPIDSQHIQAECGTPVSERAMPSEQWLSEDSLIILEAWADRSKASIKG